MDNWFLTFIAYVGGPAAIASFIRGLWKAWSDRSEKAETRQVTMQEQRNTAWAERDAEARKVRILEEHLSDYRRFCIEHHGAKLCELPPFPDYDK